MIERGTLRLFRTCAVGNEVTLGTFSAGAVLGLSPCATAVLAASTLEAVDPNTVVHVLPRCQVDVLFHRSPELALRVIAHLGQQVQTLVGRVEELAFHPVRTRLAHELGTRSQACEQQHVDATHEELAAWVEPIQAEVTRALRVLRAEGLIRSSPHRRGITVLDPGKLAGY